MKALLYSLTVIFLSSSALYSEEIPSWATPIESKASRVVEGAAAKIIFLKGERLSLVGSSNGYDYSSLVLWDNDLWVCQVLAYRTIGSIKCISLQD